MQRHYANIIEIESNATAWCAFVMKNSPPNGESDSIPPAIQVYCGKGSSEQS